MQTASNWKTSNKRRFRTCCVSIDNLNSFVETTSIVEMFLLHKLNQRLNQNWVSCERPYVSEWALKTQQKWKERDEDGTETKSTKKRERKRGRSFFEQNKRYKKETKKERKNNDRGTIIKQKKENPRMVSLQKKKV